MLKSLKWLTCAFAIVAFTGFAVARDDEKKEKEEGKTEESKKDDEGKSDQKEGKSDKKGEGKKGDAPARKVPLQGQALKIFRDADKNDDKSLDESEFANAFQEAKQFVASKMPQKSSGGPKKGKGQPPQTKRGPAGGGGRGGASVTGDAADWFKKADTDKDKKISESEFASGFNKIRESLRAKKKEA